MKKLKKPAGYKIHINKPTWLFKGPFGWYNINYKVINIYPTKAMPTWFGLRDFMTNMVLRHELGHAQGIKGCNKPWCVMFEAEMLKEKWREVWWERPLAAFFNVFNGFRFCKTHEKQVEWK